MYINIPESDGGHFFKMATISSLKITLLIGFSKLVILVSHHTVLTMHNLNVDLRNSVKAYFTKYETKS